MQTSSRHVLLATVLVLATACGSKDGEGGKTKQQTAPQKLTITDVLGSTKQPALLGPFATGTFGMTKEELEAAVPVYKDKGDFLSKRDFGLGFYASLEGPPSDPSAKTAPKRFTSLIISLTDDDAKAVRAAWGEGAAFDHGGKPRLAWFDPAARIRGVLADDSDPGAKKLTLEPYLPAKEILGAPGKPLGVETKQALIGSTADELKAAYPENFTRNMTSLLFMEWPSDELGDAFKIELRTKDGKVESLQFWLHHGDNATMKADLKALLEAKYGAATEIDSSLGKKLRLSESPKVMLAETKGAWVVEVGYPY